MELMLFTLPHEQAFGFALDNGLVRELGASALLYAVMTYAVFDDPFYCENIIESEVVDYRVFIDWVEYFIEENINIITIARNVFNAENAMTHYHLIRISYHGDELGLFASEDHRDFQHTNEWRVLVKDN